MEARSVALSCSSCLMRRSSSADLLWKYSSYFLNLEEYSVETTVRTAWSLAWCSASWSAFR